jgi:NitT/TauT family transport system substrate-binding protein
MNSSRVSETLRIYGNLSLLEMAPVLIAADGIYPGSVVIEHGGVGSLWGKAADLPSLAAAGESDIAANSETQALRYSFANPDLRFIFTLAVCPYRIVCRRSAGIGELADLRGKRVGTMRKSSAEYFLDRMLRTVDMTAQDVTIVSYMAKTQTPLTLLPDALVNGTLDAVTVWEPMMQKTARAIGADAITFCDPPLYSERFMLCSTAAKLVDPSKRAKIVAFLRALVEATRRLRLDPRHAQALVAKRAELELQTVEDSWPCLSYPGQLSPDIVEVLVPADAWVAQETGRHGRSPEQLALMIDTSALDEALAR